MKRLVIFWVLIVFLLQISISFSQDSVKGGFTSCTAYNYKYKWGELDNKSKQKKWEYKYDYNGNMFKKLSYSYWAGEVDSCRKETYKFCDTGKIKIEDMYYDKNGDYQNGYICKLDENGKNIIEKLEYESRKLINKNTYFYDSFSNLIEEVSYRSNDSIEWKDSYKYDSVKGNMKERVSYDWKGIGRKITYIYFDGIIYDEINLRESFEQAIMDSENKYYTSIYNDKEGTIEVIHKYDNDTSYKRIFKWLYKVKKWKMIEDMYYHSNVIYLKNTFTWDNNGNIIDQMDTVFEKSGMVSSFQKYSFRPDETRINSKFDNKIGKLKEKLFYNSDSTISGKQTYIECEINGKTVERMIEDLIYQSKNSVENRVSFIFDNKRGEIKVVGSGASGSIRTYYMIKKRNKWYMTEEIEENEYQNKRKLDKKKTYKNGYLIEDLEYKSDGSIDEKKTYKNGYLIEDLEYSLNSSIDEKTTFKFFECNMIEKIEYHRDGSIDKNTWKFDKFGNMTEKIKYVNLFPTEKIEYIYSK